jgi:hypothetical protein
MLNTDEPPPELMNAKHNLEALVILVLIMAKEFDMKSSAVLDHILMTPGLEGGGVDALRALAKAAKEIGE